MVKAIPFLVEGWHAPATPTEPVKPDLLSKSGRSDRRHRWVPGKSWDPVDKSFFVKTTRGGVSRIAGQTGTQDPDPTTRPPTQAGWSGQRHYLHPPCRLPSGSSFPTVW